MSCVGYACADDSLNVALYTANSCSNDCDKVAWLQDPTNINRTRTSPSQTWWDNATCWRANTGATISWSTTYSAAGAFQVVVSNVSRFAALDVISVGMREIRALSSVHTSSDGSGAGTLGFAEALSVPVQVGTAMILLGQNNTWIGTQDVSFDGDYNTVVGNRMSEFLQGCSTVTNVSCTNVQAGSIVLSLQGNTVALAQAVSGLQDNGLSVPGFSNITAVTTNSATQECSTYTSQSTCDLSICHWTLSGTCKERDYKQFDYGSYVDGPIIRQDSRCHNTNYTFNDAKTVCTADHTCAFLLAIGCGESFRTCSFDITSAVSGAVAGSDSCTIMKPICVKPAVGMLPYNFTSTTADMNLTTEGFSVTGLSCNPGYGGNVVTTVCTQAATAFSVSGCELCNNYTTETACTAAHCRWTGQECWQAVQQYSHLDYGLYVDGPRVDDDVYKETFCADTAYNFTEAKSVCDADASCQFLHNTLCDDAGWRTCSTAVEGVSNGDHTSCTIVKVTTTTTTVVSANQGTADASSMFR